MSAMEPIRLTECDPESLKQAEASKILAILPKLAGLKKIIAVVEARAKELLAENTEVFGGKWVLSEGATDRRIVDSGKFIEAMMELKDKNGEHPVDPEQLLSIASYSVGKAEMLIAEALGCSKRDAADVINSLGDEIVQIGRKAPSLKEGK